jgi:methylglyoxal synthase
MAQKYEPDFSTLLRVCDIHKIPNVGEITKKWMNEGGERKN